jgi:salicylate hydroxylase
MLEPTRAGTGRHKLSVAVIGGGIGGLTTALALHRAGIDVQVHEQSRGQREVGAGITIGPNASRVLHALGLADALRRVAVQPVAWHQRRWDDGSTLSRTPLGDAMHEAFGFPHYQVHRADLIAALEAALPPGLVHTGRRLVSIDRIGPGAQAAFADGTRVHADLIVGADGIRSAVRSALFGADAPAFGRCVAYRGLIPAERVRRLDLETTAQLWMGPGRHVVHYYVRSRQLVNFVAVIDQDDWADESWRTEGDVRDLRAAFAGWHPQVRSIIDALPETFKWALFDRPPLARWSSGPVALLGDAAHPMMPCMAQGAAQAIEDACTLAALLAEFDGSTGDIATVLERYGDLRRHRATKIQALSAQNKVRFHLDDGDAQRQRDVELAAGARQWSPAGSAWLYGHDPSDTRMRAIDEAPARPTEAAVE